jgi:Transmembrane domain of unknown function (DUF3566)
VDQRVEPPSWLPGGTGSSDAEGPASPDSAANGQDSDGPESQGPVSSGQAGSDPGVGDSDLADRDPGSSDLGNDDFGNDDFGTGDPGTQASIGDPPGQDAAGMNAYSYIGETLQSNGQDAAFGPGRASVSGYGQESGYAGGLGGTGNPPPYPAQFAGATAAPESRTDTSRRTADFSAVSRTKAKASPGTRASRGRRADLVVARFEPWSVMKFSFLISLVAWVILFVAVAVLYFALSALGVFDSVQRTLESVTSSSGSAGVSLSKWFSASRILGYTMLIGAVNIILITALSTVGAMIYNLVTHLGGGIEVTLRETD